MVSRVKGLKNFVEVLFSQQLQNAPCAIPSAPARYRVPRPGTGRKAWAEGGQIHLVLKACIPGKALLEKLNRSAGVIRDSVPSRCGFSSR